MAVKDNLKPYQPGVSGNPQGSPYGSRHRAARLLDTLAEDAAQDLFRLIMEAATAGDTTAMRIVADRIWPPRKGRPVRLNFPADLDPLGSMGVVLKGLADGSISPEEASNVTTTLMAQARLQEAKRSQPQNTRSRVVLYLPENGRPDKPQPTPPVETREPVAEVVHDTDAVTISQREEADECPDFPIVDGVAETVEAEALSPTEEPEMSAPEPSIDEVSTAPPTDETVAPGEPEPALAGRCAFRTPMNGARPPLGSDLARWRALAS